MTQLGFTEERNPWSVRFREFQLIYDVIEKAMRVREVLTYAYSNFPN